MEIPRAIIDAKMEGTSIDANYFVTIDGKNMTRNVREVKRDLDARRIEISFDRANTQIEIFGSKILPSFINVTSVLRDSNLTIGIMAPTFTAAAYNNAFYKFYQAFDHTPPTTVKNITTNLDLLTGTIPQAGS